MVDYVLYRNRIVRVSLVSSGDEKERLPLQATVFTVDFSPFFSLLAVDRATVTLFLLVFTLGRVEVNSRFPSG